MSFDEMVALFTLKLQEVDSFKKPELFMGLDNTQGKAGRALSQALEEVAEKSNRRFRPTGVDGIYRVADSKGRVRRVQNRRRAATNILHRALKEVRRIDPSSLTDKERGSLDFVERNLSDLAVRTAIQKRRAAKKRPAGL